MILPFLTQKVTHARQVISICCKSSAYEQAKYHLSVFHQFSIYIIQTPILHNFSRFSFCCKNTRFENTGPWPNLPLLRNLTLLCGILSIQIKVPGVQSLFNILLVKWHALLTSYRPESSKRNIWLAAPNLTNEIYYALVKWSTYLTI